MVHPGRVGKALHPLIYTACEQGPEHGEDEPDCQSRVRLARRWLLLGFGTGRTTLAAS